MCSERADIIILNNPCEAARYWIARARIYNSGKVILITEQGEHIAVKGEALFGKSLEALKEPYALAAERTWDVEKETKHFNSAQQRQNRLRARFHK